MRQDLAQIYDRLNAQRARLLVDKRKKKKQMRQTKKSIEDHLKAKHVLNEVARLTQEQAKAKIEKLITIAIRTVYDDRDFTFHLQGGENRNQMIPIIKEGEDEYSPKEALGGGIIDIISFASRVILWSMESPRSLPVFILDEPFKWTGSLMERAGLMLKQLSRELGFQVILVSHDDDLIQVCDRVWRISYRSKRSRVKLIKGKVIKRRKRNA